MAKLRTDRAGYRPQHTGPANEHCSVYVRDGGAWDPCVAMHVEVRIRVERLERSNGDQRLDEGDHDRRRVNHRCK